MDFKLTAGLNISESTVQIKKDIREIEDALKKAGTGVEVVAKTKFHVTEVRSSLKAAIDNSKNGVHAEIGTKFNPNEIKKSVTAAINAASNIPKLPIQIDVDTYLFQQSIQTSINGLPPVLLNVDVNPTSLQNLLKGLTKQLDLKLSPKTPKTSSSVGYDGYSGRQLSTFNKADSVLQKMYELENVTTKAERRIIKEYAKIHQAIESATTAEDYDIINKHIQKMDNMVKGLQSRTLDKKEVVQVKAVRDKYQEMYLSLENIGEEHTFIGQCLKQELDLLKQASEYSHRRVIDAGELDNIKEAIKGQKDYAAAIQHVQELKASSVKLQDLGTQFNKFTLHDDDLGLQISNEIARINKAISVATTDAARSQIADDISVLEQLLASFQQQTLGTKTPEIAAVKNTLMTMYESVEKAYGKANADSSEFGSKIKGLINDLNALANHNEMYVFGDAELERINQISLAVSKLNTDMSATFQQQSFGDASRVEIQSAVKTYQELLTTIRKAKDESSTIGRALSTHIKSLQSILKEDIGHVFSEADVKNAKKALDYVTEAKKVVRETYRDQSQKDVNRDAFHTAETKLLSLQKSLQNMGLAHDSAQFDEINTALDLLRKRNDLMSKSVWNKQDRQEAIALKHVLDDVIESTEKYHQSAKKGYKTIDALAERLGKLKGVGVESAKTNIASLHKELGAAKSVEDFNKISAKIQQVTKDIKGLEKNTFNTTYRKTIASTVNEYEKMLNVVQHAGDEHTSLGGSLRNTIALLKQVMSIDENHVFGEKMANKVREAIDSVKRLKNEVADVYQTGNDTKSQQNYFNKAIENLTKSREALRKLGNYDGLEVKNIDELINKLKLAKSWMSKESWNKNDKNEALRLRQEVEKVTASIKQFKQAAGADFFDTSLIHKFQVMRNDLISYVKDNSKVLSNADLRREYEFLSKANYWDYKGSKAGVEQYVTAIDNFKAAAHHAGLEAKTFTDRLKGVAAGMSISNLISRFSYRLLYVFKDAIANVKTLDSAMTELKKVTDESSASYGRFMQNAKKQAQEVGATLSDVIYSTADFARLGYSIEEATELSRVSTIYKNVGDGFESVTESSEALISIMKAFGVETENVITIADKLNNIGNKNAISSGGLGRALQTSASALMEAGASMEEAMALVTGANGVIQDPSQVGAGLRTNDCPYVQKCA